MILFKPRQSCFGQFSQLPTVAAEPFVALGSLRLYSYVLSILSPQAAKYSVPDAAAQSYRDLRLIVIAQTQTLHIDIHRAYRQAQHTSRHGT